jgi:hypothetical protein
MARRSGIKPKSAVEAVSLEILQKQDTTDYGDHYRAYLKIRGRSGQLRRIRTVWIVLTGESIARFVTAVPDSLGK